VRTRVISSTTVYEHDDTLFNVKRKTFLKSTKTVVCIDDDSMTDEIIGKKTKVPRKYVWLIIYNDKNIVYFIQLFFVHASFQMNLKIKKNLAEIVVGSVFFISIRILIVDTSKKYPITRVGVKRDGRIYLKK